MITRRRFVVGATPTLFAAIAATSPAIWRSFADTTGGTFDSAADFTEYDVHANVAALAGLPLRVDCGTGDGFYPAVKDFASRLPGANLGRFGRGYHDVPFWRSVAPAQIETFATVFGRA